MPEIRPRAPSPLADIPSPSRRLWFGLCVVLSIFIVFAVYTIHEVRWLEDFQVNVVQSNRKASLQLLRLQNDAYLVALSLREMTEAAARYPIANWEAEFMRLHQDMDDAVELESKYAVAVTGPSDKNAQLRSALQDFWRTLNQVFVVAQGGQEAAARSLVQSQVEPKRAVVSETVARLLVLNDRAQAEATQRINSVYGSVKRNILVVIAVLFLLALGTGLYTLQANRKTFQTLHDLAEKLQVQSEQLRKLSWKLIDVQEETLRRVARDLHDEFGQILTGIGAMLSRLGHKTLASDPRFLEELQAVKEVVEGTLEKVRDESQMLRPAVLDDFGLEQTLGWFVEQFSRQAGLKVHFEGKLRDALFPPEEAIHVYRIVQEALSNVARHSRAQEAWVTLRDQSGQLNLEVRDNGEGFEASVETNVSTGMGLMGMRERAEHLGGSFIIQSVPGMGTVVKVSVPARTTVQSRIASGE